MHQTFAPSDLPVLAFLVLLEGLLSVDNSIVLAVMVRHLPPEQQRRALLYGLGGAFVLRFAAILLAATLIRIWWLQSIGALYLIYLAVSHFWKKGQPETSERPQHFWRTVVAVELTDISFAMDSVLAGVAVVRGDQSKIWVVYSGAILGIVLLRFAAILFIRLLNKYPALDSVAYMIIFWVGINLGSLAANKFSHSGYMKTEIPELPASVFWSVLALICMVGSIWAYRATQAEAEGGKDV